MLIKVARNRMGSSPSTRRGFPERKFICIVPLDPAYPARSGAGHLPVTLPAFGGQGNFSHAPL
jgi:hypothetical protein